MEDLPQKLSRVRAISVKKGNWLGLSDDFMKPFELPFIDHCGKFTGCTLYRSVMNQQDYIATLIATVAKRIDSWAWSHSKILKKDTSFLKTLVTRVSTIYVLTKNSYFIDRILVLLKNFQRHKKAITGLVAHFANKLDANKGFIYGQACSHAHWLTSRASRPRDKSSPKLHTFPFREVGVTDFTKRKVWIFDSVYRTSMDIQYLGKSYFSVLRPSEDYV